MNNMIPQYDTKLLTEVWESVNDFCYDYQHNGIPTSISVNSAMTLYYLLYSKYGNNPIANFDEEQFKYKIFAIVFQFGPTWEKRLDVQKKIRELTVDELREGSFAKHNHAYNPTEASTSDEVLDYINEQNTTKYNKSKMDAYGQLWELLKFDVTGEFLSKFQGCFKQFVNPERTYIYVSEDE